MKLSLKTILFLLLCTLFGVHAQESGNVLFIIADDMGVDAISGYGIGTDLPVTPHLDELRASGVTFTNVWATPVCAATRASLVTGEYGVNNGVNALPGYLKTTETTVFTEIAERQPDYATCVVGKWHLGRLANLEHPIKLGVGEFMGVLDNGVEDYYKWLKVEDGVQDTCFDYVTSYFTDYAIEWINEQEDPWLMWLAHVAPHIPYHTVPEEMHTSAGGTSPAVRYKTMIESLDYEIGRLLDSIPSDVLAKTTIMFLGDNGTPGNVIQGFSSDDAKGSLKQGGINVPFIASGYGVSREGEMEDALINVSDFYATITQLVDDEAYPDGVANDGMSFKHLLTQSGGSTRAFNYMELGVGDGMSEDIYTVCDAQYKLIDLASEGFVMYDLEHDIFETENLLLGNVDEEILQAKDDLLLVMDSIRGFSREIVVDTDSVVHLGTYSVVHTGVSEFYDASDLIATPDVSDDLYWQDAGRVVNAANYTDNGDGTVTDNITGLMWQQNMGDMMSYTDAEIAASECRLGTYDDWRVPTIKELYSLILFTGRVWGEEAETYFIDVNYFDQPLGDVDAGEREIDAQTWSSTHYTSVTMRNNTTIFGVNFIDGRIKGYSKYDVQTGDEKTKYFRLVRDNADYGQNDFVDNTDGTVTDKATSLMWQQADDGVGRDWTTAISYCESLDLAGYTDWHLPHAKELHSIVDYSRSPDATQSAAIDEIFYTSSTDDAEGNPGQYPYFWTTSPHKDGVNPYSSAVYIAFGEATGQMNSTLLDVHGAGSQRSDPKSGDASDYPQYFGPQGDEQRVYNYCRCMRNVDASSHLQDDDEVAGAVTLYPNPSDGMVQFSFAHSISTASVTVYDVMGKVMMQSYVDEAQNTLDISSLDSGIYVFVVAVDGQNALVQNIILM